jgi:hypothetical protein
VIGQGYGRGFTAAEKTELWDRRQRGESLKAIGRAFGKPSSSIYFQLAPHGGIRPAPRRRSRLALTLSEREEISRGIAAAQSARSMARLLGRSPSTVSRELNCNGGYDRYWAALADETAWARAGRPKRCKSANNPRLRQAVASKLRLNWSPEQIGVLRTPFLKPRTPIRRIGYVSEANEGEGSLRDSELRSSSPAERPPHPSPLTPHLTLSRHAGRGNAPAIARRGQGEGGRT